MLWIVKELFSASTAKPKNAYSKPRLEILEGRAVPTVAPTPFEVWFQQNLGKDPALCRRATALFNQGNDLNYSDMINLFRFTATLHPTISAYDLGALRRLVAHSTQVGWMPEHVGNLSQKLLTYNTSNYYFQFRISSTTNQPIASNLLPKGMLQAGQPSSVLNTLVQKWFLGQDHPDMASVRLDDARTVDGLPRPWAPLANTNSTYQVASGVLWASNGPSFEDMDQGYAGDCYFLSSLASTVSTSPQSIRDMFIDNGNGTYTIRFFIPNSSGTKFTADYVTVDKYLPFQFLESQVTSVGTYPAGWYFQFANGGPTPEGPGVGDFGSLTNLNTGPVSLAAPYTYPHATNVLWAPLLEKAYAQFNSEIPVNLRPLGPAQHNLPAGANSYYVIGQGGYAANEFNNAGTIIKTYGALSEINGTPSTWYELPNQGGTTTANTIANLLNAGQAVTVVSMDSVSGKGGSQIVTGHVYYITAYNSTTGEFTVRNPWGYKNTSQGKTGTLFLPFSGVSPSLNSDYLFVAASPVPRSHTLPTS